MCILVYVEVVEELVVKTPLKGFNPNSMLHLLILDEEEEDKYALKTKLARCPTKKSNCSRYTFGKNWAFKKMKLNVVNLNVVKSFILKMKMKLFN